MPGGVDVENATWHVFFISYTMCPSCSCLVKCTVLVQQNGSHDFKVTKVPRTKLGVGPDHTR